MLEITGYSLVYNLYVITKVQCLRFQVGNVIGWLYKQLRVGGEGRF